MAAIFTVRLKKLCKEFSLETIYTPKDPNDILISSADVNRPGMYFAGFYEFFDNKRIQIVGKSEHGYLDLMEENARRAILEKFFAERPVCVMFTRGLDIFPEVYEFAKQYEVAVLRTQDSTSAFQSALISILNVELAPRITRHGVLVEVYGEGILLLGESGVGKSETAIELVKRGHRLIADDAVEIRRVSNRTLIGTSPENIRHFLELRGVGIINARRIFGMGSVKVTEKIDLIINLELWDQTKMYDRMGLETEYTTILGIDIPSTTIPVKPGRNLAIIIEVAAMNHRQKKMGYNAAQELLNKLSASQEENETDMDVWDAYV